MKALPLIVFQSDWTYKEGAVAASYGVIKTVDPKIEIFTATHELPKFDIYSASYRLRQYVEFWPKGTVFISVVDPGVGTERRASVAKTKNGYYIVSPDNGSLTHMHNAYGIEEIRIIDEELNRLTSTKGTSVFHGRDLFAYCGAKLASGNISFEEVGAAYQAEEIVLLDIADAKYEYNHILGCIEIDDPNFGNLWSNIETEKMLENGFEYGDYVDVIVKHKEETIYERKTLFRKTFGDVQKGEVVLYNNELMKASLAVSQGSFLEEYQAGFGTEYTIELRKE